MASCMKCRGCEANLKEMFPLPLVMSEDGRLIVKCPNCLYEHFGKTTHDGFVMLVAQEDD